MSERTILVADDESHILHVVSLKLRNAGYAVLCARDGQEALDLCTAERPDLLITDYHMPQLSGLQVVKLTRDFQSPPPAILVSKDLTNHFMQEALGMKVFSVLAKPCEPNLLLDTLARAVKRHYQNRWPQ